MSDETIRAPIHPGRVLSELFMEPLGLSQNRLAEALHVDPGRINRIVTGKTGISADSALRLAKYFGTTPQVWMNLQSKYDLDVVRHKKAAEIERSVRARPKDEVTVLAEEL